MYHLELRQFPHVARAFNLDRAELDTRFLNPWVKGDMIEHEDRRWPPERTRLKVLEGPEVGRDELGLGRGWGQVTKASEDVTDAVIAEAERGARSRPAVEALKDTIEQSATDPIGFPSTVELAADSHPGWRASEVLSLAEQAVWELLHQGRMTMFAGGEPVAREQWQAVVLGWTTWAGAGHASPYALRRPLDSA